MHSRLAARLRRLEAQAHGTEALPGEGLAALLDYARRQTAEACAPAPVPQGLHRLLEEARQMREKAPQICPEHLPTG